MFQSPQWGSNSKEVSFYSHHNKNMSFSPRNGEVILKAPTCQGMWRQPCFSPRNGEVILKEVSIRQIEEPGRFSPRNGEVILKRNRSDYRL